MKIKLTLEMDIEIDKAEYPDLDEQTVLNGIQVYDDDVIDGFGLTTNIKGYDNTADFFLQNARIVSKEALPEIAETMDMTL